MVGIAPSGGQSAAHETLLRRWRSEDPDKYPGANNTDANVYSLYAYDAVLVVAAALDSLISSQSNVRTGQVLLDQLQKAQVLVSWRWYFSSSPLLPWCVVLTAAAATDV